MKAVVMAGGEGSRLRPLTLERPKPMVQVINRPMLEHILLLLKRHGITDVVLTVQYMANYIQTQIGDGSDLGMNVTYSVEETPLGTAGSVRQAADALTETFLVISGDALTDIDLSAIIDYHKVKKSMATLTLYRVPSPLEYGVVVTDSEGRIQEFQEKPSWSEVVTDTINTGIYVLEPSIFEYYEPNQVFDFSKDLFPMLLREKKPLFGYTAEGYWTDVGNLDEYVRATRDVLANRVKIDWSGQCEGDIWREEGADVASDAILNPPIYLGRDVKIGRGAVIHGPTVLGDNVVVERGAHVDRSIIWRNTYLGAHSEVRGGLVATDCTIQANAVVFENAVIADETSIGRGAIVQPNVKIWPHKEVDAGAVVSTSIIWGSAGRRVLFGRRGVSGLINVDFTPDMLSRVGSAYASTFPVGCNMTINRDLAVPSRMLKWAVASGIPSAGANALDLAAVPVPVARFYTRNSEALGGVHVRLSSQDRAVAHLAFFDRNGMDLDTATQRKIETAYFREDFRRAHVDDVGTIIYAPGVKERYTEAFMQVLDRDAIAASGYRLVVDYSLGTTSDFLPGILRSLGCNVIDLNASQGLTRTVRSSAEYQTAYGQLATMVPALGFELGAMLDVNGERLEIVDHDGEQITQMQIMAVLAWLVFQAEKSVTVAVPADAPTVFETLARQYGGKVVRTRLDTSSIMSSAAGKGISLGGDGRGRIIFPSLHPVYDGMFGFVKLLELLSKARTTLHDAVAGLPEWYLKEGDVSCPWDKRGRVMRMLGEQYRERRVRGTDGIKIQLGAEWVLILPDPDEPRFHIVAEGKTERKAESLIEKYSTIVLNLQR